MGWEQSSKAGAQAFQDGDYSAAERHLARALAEGKQPGVANRLLAHTMNDLAVLYHALGRLAEAESLYRRAIDIDDTSGVPASPEFVTTLENVAELYRTQERKAEAANMYRRAATMADSLYRKARAASGDDHPGLVPHLSMLASLAEAQGDLAAAEECYRRILAIHELTMAPGQIEFAGPLGMLAYVLTLRGSFEEAETLYRRALRIEEDALGPGHPDVAATLLGLATLYHQRGDDTKAEMFASRALEMLEAAFGPNHRETAAAIKSLASLLAVQKRYAEADPLHRRLIEIDEATLGADHPLLVTELIDLAALHCDRKQYDNAEPLVRRAMKIAMRNTATSGLSALHLMELYARLLDKLGRTSDAAEISARAAALRAKVA